MIQLIADKGKLAIQHCDGDDTHQNHQEGREGEQIDRPMKTAGNVLLGLVLALLGVYIYVSTRYETRPKFGKAGAALPVTAAAAATFAAVNLNRERKMIKQKKTDISSDSHGGGGGGFSGGGGGGSSGGSGSHGF